MTAAASPSGGGGGSPPPPPAAPKPPPLHTSKSLWDPVGDPGKLRACAHAWRTLGSQLTQLHDSVTGIANGLSGAWSGDAHDHFTAWVRKYTRVLNGAVRDCATMAKQLDDTANYLEEKNNEIHRLYEAIAVTAAVGIGLSIVTFGFSDAAAAGAAAGEAAEAETVLAGIGTYLSSMATSMASTLSSFASRWAAAFAIQVGVNEGLKVVQGQPLSFNLNDLTNSINGATAVAVIPANPVGAGGAVPDLPTPPAALSGTSLAPQLGTTGEELAGINQTAKGLAGGAGAETAGAGATMDLPEEQTWGNPSTLARHFRDHGADFGATSAEDYVNQASSFFQRSQLEGLPTKIDAEGAVRVYDPETNTFGAYNPNGTTMTFYTPKSGIDYWNRQPGSPPWTGP